MVLNTDWQNETRRIHRCKMCGTFSSNRVASDDNPMKLMSIAMKPIGHPPLTYNKKWSNETGYPLVVIKNAAHNSNDDKPEEVNKIIEDFLLSIG